MSFEEEREELRGTLCNSICNVSLYTKRAQPYLLGGDMSAVLDKTADNVLAAGYRKPRAVTTIQELDALAPCSVVLSDMGVVWEKDVDTEDPEFPWWCSPGDSHRYPARRISFPATVIYEPRP